MRIPVIKIASFLAMAALAGGVHAQQPSFTVVASGLNAPRGLSFGPDGALYVAEAGKGGTTATTPKDCEQVPPPIGPYLGGSTGRVSKIVGGNRVSLATGFASAQTATGDLIGIADITFLDGELYALIAGGGCSHGHAHAGNGVARVDLKSGSWVIFANMSAYLTKSKNQTKYEAAGDFEPDGTAYTMIAHNGGLVVVEPNHGEILSVSKQGTISRLIDVSAAEGHIVPTSIAFQQGAFYVGNLNLFPINPDWARILTITDDAQGHELAPGFATQGYHIINSKAGFTTVLSVKFGPDGLLYALELSDGEGFPALGQGKVVRVKHSGDIETVVSGLNVPGGMTFGPDGHLYVSDFSAVPAPMFGAGRILKFAVPAAN